jgi:hypothetical protein
MLSSLKHGDSWIMSFVKERKMFVAKHFLSNVIEEGSKYPISTYSITFEYFKYVY